MLSYTCFYGDRDMIALINVNTKGRNIMNALATNFSRARTEIRSNVALTDDQIMAVAPSIFAEDKHSSRSDRYTYIPTIDVLQALRKEGFQPFMAAQTRSRNEDKREHTKHMLRLRHPSQIESKQANEIILLNSHDGTSSYQMLAGVYRFVCANGMVCGDTMSDVRVRHKGNVIDNVIEGAFRVLEDFELVDEQREGMQALTLNSGEQQAFAKAALSLKYDDEEKGAPITENQILHARRSEDMGNDMWSVFNRVQENMLKGRQPGRVGNRRVTTREVKGIDQNVKLNRSLWILAESMKALKANG